jgi:hypothetical protein
MSIKVTDAAYNEALAMQGLSSLIPKPPTPSQLAVVRQLQAGSIMHERRSKTEQKPYYKLDGITMRRDAVAALLAHGLIERGAEPIKHDYYLECVLRGQYDVWHWNLTAKGKEWA